MQTDAFASTSQRNFISFPINESLSTALLDRLQVDEAHIRGVLTLSHHSRTEAGVGGRIDGVAPAVLLPVTQEDTFEIRGARITCVDLANDLNVDPSQALVVRYLSTDGVRTLPCFVLLDTNEPTPRIRLITVNTFDDHDNGFIGTSVIIHKNGVDLCCDVSKTVALQQLDSHFSTDTSYGRKGFSGHEMVRLHGYFFLPGTDTNTVRSHITAIANEHPYLTQQPAVYTPEMCITV